MRVTVPITLPVALPIVPSIALLLAFLSLDVAAQDRLLIDRVEHHNVYNDDVNVHYVTLGEATTGETLLFVHGFPNFFMVSIAQSAWGFNFMQMLLELLEPPRI